ncbi:general transcription factor 3C polypeptide 6 isoform X1 [Oncorhynchus nerka]|uniref:general transcription factor 3C polypeptide 6 isoform X1 n=1 Tax=Oncorhynchus nerka TaxID=8023 RepID=UPI001131DFD8|nr:general transcription factor 3C polypeptide 6 isoform X1 [Oncorhynchus nerka]
MEDEWEEEEQLVVVELSGIINSDFLTKCQGTCKILDIDSEQPMMQVGRYVFAGEYDDALGTCVLFEEGQSSGADPEASPELSYKCHTVKRLMMQRTFLAEKKEGDNSSGYTHRDFQFQPLSDGMSPARLDSLSHFIQNPKRTSKPAGEGGAHTMGQKTG